MRRWVKLLVLVDLVLFAFAVGGWAWLHRDSAEANAVNPGLRGSLPPAGARMPDLSGIAGIEPPMPAPSEPPPPVLQPSESRTDAGSGSGSGGQAAGGGEAGTGAAGASRRTLPS